MSTGQTDHTQWFDIDATSSKLSAVFSDEFATLSKRTPNITGVRSGYLQPDFGLETFTPKDGFQQYA